jgi:hypothetical protein
MIGAVEKRRARGQRFDYRLAGRTACNAYPVAAREIPALAAGDAVEDGSVGEFDQVAPPVRGNDLAILQGGVTGDW